MCNCIKTIEEKTLETLRENNEGQFDKAEGLCCTQFPIVKGQFLDRQTYNEYQFLFSPIRKDGTVGKVKKRTVNISHTYCPFCGEKYKND